MQCNASLNRGEEWICKNNHNCCLVYFHTMYRGIGICAKKETTTEHLLLLSEMIIRLSWRYMKQQWLDWGFQQCNAMQCTCIKKHNCFTLHVKWIHSFAYEKFQNVCIILDGLCEVGVDSKLLVLFGKLAHVLYNFRVFLWMSHFWIMKKCTCALQILRWLGLTHLSESSWYYLLALFFTWLLYKCRYKYKNLFYLKEMF